jgi:hypothetical protein
MSSLFTFSVRTFRYWALVFWSGFLTACMLQGLVFAMVDPSEVHWSGHIIQPSRQAVYTLAFFSFWSIGAISCALSLWLAQTSQET